MEKTARHILMIGNWKMERIDGRLHLVGSDDRATKDVFEMLEWIKKDKRLQCEDVYSIRLSKEDRRTSSINLIYLLTGHDKFWKQDVMWKHEWKDCVQQLLEWFEPKCKRMLKKAQTLGQLKSYVQEQLGCEDFFEFGIKHDLIRINE